MAPPARLIDLTEFQSLRLPENEFSAELGSLVWSKYRDRIDIEFPSVKTDHCWELTSKGWVGFLPLDPDVALHLRPKVDLANLFGMLEYAYGLRSFHVLDGLIESSSLSDFFSSLAKILASRVLDRSRKGLYRDYLQRAEDLPFLRGRLVLQRMIRTPWKATPHCRYEENTSDNDENQILLWTLLVIARSGLCNADALPVVRRAFRAMNGPATLMQHPARACVGRLYNRLNDDYAPMHALCRFFLDHAGPSHDTGDKAMLPFLINMASLFERFVAEWLRENLPGDLELRYQERINVDRDGRLHFDVDMVLEDSVTGDARFVLDAKYKNALEPSTGDVQQVVTYAQAKSCTEAVLVYPTDRVWNPDEKIGTIRVRALGFMIDRPLAGAGATFLNLLLDGQDNAGTRPE